VYIKYISIGKNLNIPEGSEMLILASGERIPEYSTGQASVNLSINNNNRLNEPQSMSEEIRCQSCSIHITMGKNKYLNISGDSNVLSTSGDSWVVSTKNRGILTAE
jgi:hypothetical protein